MVDLLIRFALGGAIVSAFAAAGSVWKPTTYAGIFGAAPSVAIATLALGVGKSGVEVAAVQARWLGYGCVALLAYCVACVVLSKCTHIPEWAAAAASWSVWLVVGAAVWLVAR